MSGLAASAVESREENPMFTGINEEMCRKVFAVLCATLKAAVDEQIANKYAGTLIILNPFAVPSSNDPAEVTLAEVREAALFMKRITDDHENYIKYDELAAKKARDLWVLRHLGARSSRDIQQNLSHLYRPGMIKYSGGTCRSGIVIAFSGVQPDFDEAISETADAWLTALCRWEMNKPDGIMASKDSSIPQLLPMAPLVEDPLD
jgi:hypothetical protein